MTIAAKARKKKAASESGAKLAIAKVFMNGRSQAVRLPKQFRFEGDEVTVERQGKGLSLQPMRKPMTKEEVEAYYKRLDSFGADPLFPDGRNQPPMPVREIFD